VDPLRCFIALLEKISAFRKVSLFVEYYKTNRTLIYLPDPVGVELMIPVVRRCENIDTLVCISVFTHLLNRRLVLGAAQKAMDAEIRSAFPTFQKPRK
jgi:hypothetical protein